LLAAKDPGYLSAGVWGGLASCCEMFFEVTIGAVLIFQHPASGICPFMATHSRKSETMDRAIISSGGVKEKL